MLSKDKFNIILIPDFGTRISTAFVHNNWEGSINPFKPKKVSVRIYLINAYCGKYLRCSSSKQIALNDLQLIYFFLVLC